MDSLPVAQDNRVAGNTDRAGKAKGEGIGSRPGKQPDAPIRRQDILRYYPPAERPVPPVDNPAHDYAATMAYSWL